MPSAAHGTATSYPVDPPSLCLVCEVNPAEIRGQFRRCRQGTSRDIAAGRVSEAYLVAKGLLLVSRQGRRRVQPPWRQKLDRIQAADGADGNPLSFPEAGREPIGAGSSSLPVSSAEAASHVRP